MGKMRVLIADDEPLAREGLRAELLAADDVEIVAECANGRAAVASILAWAPELVLLDVQMPLLDGFGVVAAVGAARMPVVIFVTAYDEYALRAFEAHALDYLLKPIQSERLHAALARAKDLVALKNNAGCGGQLAALLEELRTEREQGRREAYPARVAVKTRERIIFLDAEEIDWIEAQDNYVRLHRGREAHLLRATMSSLEGKLPAAQFLRIRRSALVNAARIKELRPLLNGEYVVVLQDGTELRSSRRYRCNLDLLLQL